MDPNQQPPQDLSSILAALAANANAAPAGAPPGTAPPGYPQQPPQQQHPGYPPQGQPQYPGAQQYGYPQPTSSGNLDLSAIKPVNSGTVSIQDAIAHAKAVAAQNGLKPYEQAPNYSTSEPRGGNDGRGYDGGAYGGGGSRDYGRSRSRSPRREPYRDNNPYRDERREERGQQPFRRDRSGSPRGRNQAFSPRGGNGGRNRSPLRGDDNTETIQIESSLVGLIIGRQGENLKRIEADSRCRVQFVPATNQADPFRLCKISGPPASREEAKQAINRIIEDSGMGAIARGGATDRPRGGRDGGRHGQDSSQTPALKEGEDLIQIMVPDRTVGLIIGRGGETIRDLQERSQCHVNIVGENKSVNGLRPVNLIGTPAAAKMAKDLIMEIVDSDSRNSAAGAGGHDGRPPRRDTRSDDGGRGGPGGGPDKQTDSIYVPSEAVGMIIGKGGEAIREMQSNTGCKINVSQSSGPGETEREIGLVGSRDAIDRAKQAIEEKVEASRNKSAGGGGRGGRGGGYGGGHGGGGYGDRAPRDDYGQSGYGQPQQAPSHGAPQGAQPGAQPPAGAAGGPDPYAACEYTPPLSLSLPSAL
ncbi:hypothetical protein GE09DRAFT_412574 [Coniochaeta sp. 2T2.1]|nr:hypothetical protein GE09DRAFT_412574 [Coniochaeta sp. 2T2.1]